MGLRILFQWSGTAFCSQLMFYKQFCVWRYPLRHTSWYTMKLYTIWYTISWRYTSIPDVSMDRDVPHVPLLLHQLVPPVSSFWTGCHVIWRQAFPLKLGLFILSPVDDDGYFVMTSMMIHPGSSGGNLSIVASISPWFQSYSREWAHSCC